MLSKNTSISSQIIRLMALIAVVTGIVVLIIGLNARFYLTEKEELQERDYLALKIKDELHVKNDVGIIASVELAELEELQSLEEVMIHGSFIDKLEQELSKPRRRSDSELDYLPTQYLSELIKSMGFDGIEFKSSLYQNGVNLAIFNPHKFKILDVSVYDIETIELNYTKLKVEGTF